MAEEKQKVYIVGHSHIDAVWLWDRNETVQVCKKTFSEVIELMKANPDFHFSQSSAAFYQWMEEKYPRLFQEIKTQVEKGAWEPAGGMWVEPDCNLPSGESLVRQLLYGKRYFKDKFNKEVKVALLPDTFGFCWTLPQILKKSGIEYFITSKLIWQTFHPFPHHAFWWKSPDGGKILGLQTIGLYINVEPEGINYQLNVLKEKYSINSLIFLFGRGDHGDGFTPEILERMNQFIKNNPGIEISFSSAERYFDSLLSEVKNKKIPVVNDELYLKTHQGTYTSFVRIKENNRRAEILLDCLERYSVLAAGFGNSYPEKELGAFWKGLLFNQFHDSLAGTSIQKVYSDSEKDFKEIFANGGRLLGKALKSIAADIDTQGEGSPLIVFNPLSWKRNGVVKIKPEFSRRIKVVDTRGAELPSQLIFEDGINYLVFIAEEISSMGYKQYGIVSTEKKVETKKYGTHLKISPGCLENEYYCVRIDPVSGWLESITDKINKKEVLSGKGGILQVYEDYYPGVQETAWNIHLGRMQEMKKTGKIKITETGPVRIKMETNYSFKQPGCADSIIREEIILYRTIPQIEFRLSINWKSRNKMLKVAFPLAVKNNYTTYEIPYGSIARINPDAAEANAEERDRVEVSAQKWIDHTDISGKYGVSLINNSRYGFDSRNNVIRMSLLRTPQHPAPYNPTVKNTKVKNMDLGKYSISFALCPHPGDWKSINIPRRAHEFNYPLIHYLSQSHKGTQRKSDSFIKIDSENIILSAMKKAEDSESTIIRLYETMGKKTTAGIRIKQGIKNAWETDMLERDVINLQVKNDFLKLKFKPYEIKTIRIA